MTSPKRDELQDLKFISWNIKGLGSPVKRNSLLNELSIEHIKIAYLQETHCLHGQNFSFDSLDYPVEYHALSQQSGSKGVSIILAKDVDWKCNQEYLDPEGRCIILDGLLYGSRVIMINIYVPNIQQYDFLSKVLEKMPLLNNETIILGGDFNIALDPNLDTSKGSSGVSIKQLRFVNKLIFDYNLVDVWRTLNPHTRSYTFFSNPHQTYSRIDYFFVKSGDLPNVKNIDILTKTLSDHSPITLIIEIKPAYKKNWRWQINNSLLQEEYFVDELRKEILFFLEIHKDTDTPLLIRWEALKCYIRGICIALASKIKKQNKAKLDLLEKQIKELEMRPNSSTEADITIQLQDLKSKASTLLNYSQKNRFLKTKSNLFEWNNKPGAVLAKQLTPSQNKRRIKKIDLGGGKFSDNDEIIAREFGLFYKNLYNLHQPLSLKQEQKKRLKIQQYLKQSEMPKFNNDIMEMLDSPLTIEQWLDTLKSVRPNTAPGPDGFTVLFYKKFADLLAKPFVDAFNSLLTDSLLPKDSLRANISVIPKEDKDTTQCSNYRPISLLNCDLKLFTKMLAMRLQPLLKDIIHPDQVGFIAQREAKDNTIRVLNALHYIQKNKIEAMLLSTDAEKAFDRVDWLFMLETLKYIGLGSGFLKWISAIYSQPSALVRINGVESPVFTIANGTRQGCPLSPIIFVLILEPFLCTVRNHGDISGLQIGSFSHKLAAYADDLIFFITSSQISLPSLLNAFEIFEDLSNFKINWRKSNALDISLTANMRQSIKTNFGFPWADSHIKYLGVNISSSFSLLFELNYLKLYEKLEVDLDKWSGLYISWFGRNAVLKMNVLPRFLYLMQTLPIQLPKKFLLQLRTLMLNFLWGKKEKHRLHRNLVSKPRSRGGMNFPDPVLYSKATHYCRILDWCAPESMRYKRWVQMEQEMSPWPLEYLPWLSKKQLNTMEDHPLIMTTLKITKERPNLFPHKKVSLMTPVMNNLECPLGLSKSGWGYLRTQGKVRLLAFKSLNKNTPIIDICELTQPPLTWLQALQLRSFILSKLEKQPSTEVLTPFEKLCNANKQIRHGLSISYKLLLEARDISDNETPSFLRKWQQELNVIFSPSQINRIISCTYKSSICSKFQENGYKIMTRWYMVPQKLYRMCPSLSPICWRCQNDIGTFLHIFWLCPLVRQFWVKVRKICKLITDIELTDRPEVFLLHLAPISMVQYKNSLILPLLNTAKICIPLLWKTSAVPKMSLWFSKINEVKTMEETLAFTHQKVDIFNHIWAPWMVFTDSADYKKALLS